MHLNCDLLVAKLAFKVNVSHYVAEELQADKLKVTFLDTSVEVLGFELLNKPFPPGSAVGRYTLNDVDP